MKTIAFIFFKVGDMVIFKQKIFVMYLLCLWHCTWCWGDDNTMGFPMSHDPRVGGIPRCHETLDTFAFLGPFLYKTFLKIIFSNYVGMKTNTLILYINFFLQPKRLIFASDFKIKYVCEPLKVCGPWALCLLYLQVKLAIRSSLYRLFWGPGGSDLLSSAQDFFART